MTTHTIKFTDTDNYLKATIDEQTLDVDIKKIIKLPTYINVLNTLDTALNNDIQIKASLYATDDEDIINITKGNVSISILDKNMSLLYQHIVSFDKQYILDNIINNFDFGEYYLKIDRSCADALCPALSRLSYADSASLRGWIAQGQSP